MLDLIIAPMERPAIHENTLFLAGGITNCPDWQETVINNLHDCDVTVFNPRRREFDVTDPSATEIQIAWEFEKLREATAILFWFPEETLCPIVLFELGAHLERDVPLFIGCHSRYTRKKDVEIQTKLARHGYQITIGLVWLIDRVRKEYTCMHDSTHKKVRRARETRRGMR